MNKKAILKKLREELSTYDDFSTIKYKAKYVEAFRKVFGPDSHFTKEANNTSTGFNVKGAAESMYGEISHEEFMKNIHIALVNLLDEAIDFLDMSADDEEAAEGSDVKNKVFIVHGHDAALKYQLSDWLRSIEVEPIILHEQANEGVTSILGKLERYSDVDCAIVLFTADDEGYEKGKPEALKSRARQNVVFEAGLLDCLVQSELLCCMIMALNCRVIWTVVSILKLTNMVAGKNNCGRNLMLWVSNINIKPCRIFAN